MTAFLSRTSGLFLTLLLASCGGTGAETDGGGTSTTSTGGASGAGGKSAGGGAGKGGGTGGSAGASAGGGAGASAGGATGKGGSAGKGGGAGGSAGQGAGGSAGQGAGGSAGASGKGGSSGASGQGGSGGTSAGGSGGTSAGGGPGAGGGGAGGSAGGSAGGGPGAGGGGAGGSAGAGGCSPACVQGFVCKAGLCVPPQATCTDDSQCKFDSHCVAGDCTPYNPGENDPTCTLFVPPEVLAPQVKCEFTAPPAGDKFPSMINVESTPMVARLGSSTPSIVAAMDGGPPPGVSCGFEDCNYRDGVIRILSGKDCTQQAVLGGVDLDADGRIDWARTSAPVAIADLDGDKVPEIVAEMVSQYDPVSNTGDEVTIAFKKQGAAWVPMWPSVTARNPDGSRFNATVPVSGASGSGWSGPSIHDLDDDGIPDIVREGYVIDGLTGVLKTGLPPGYSTYSTGIVPVIANIDADARVEMTNGAHVWEYDPTTKAWVDDPAYVGPGTTPPGWSAVADFDPYDGQGLAEIAVVSSGTVRVYTTTHSVFGGVSLTLPSGGGGPPTIADFDGDGLPEIGVATADYYFVIDPDCQATARPGGQCTSRDQCQHAAGGACPDLILWSRRSQDHSSRITGSSVFDFEADGKAEVVYADECFARVYAGSDGKVLFSLYHSSSTWQENPVVADVDGDFRADLVVASNGNFPQAACSSLLEPNGVETHFAGVICDKAADCPSGVCDAGLCRCTASSECCVAGTTDSGCIELGRQCAPPPAGTPGTGNTCRASFPHGSVGIRVYEDSRDRWVKSRQIWNQHAYSVTNVEEDGTVPKTSAWVKNWSVSALNNFRQNNPGEPEKGFIPDLTAQVGLSATCYLNTGGSGATLQAPVCNRGTAPVGNNLKVGFYVGTTKICEGTIVDPIAPGDCADAFCDWATPPLSSSEAVDVKVIPNDGGEKSECDTLNNDGLVKGVFCTDKP